MKTIGLVIKNKANPKVEEPPKKEPAKVEEGKK